MNNKPSHKLMHIQPDDLYLEEKNTNKKQAKRQI